MNMVEQSLRARVQRLENRNAAMMLTLQRVILDLETSESVACAFAWDLVETGRRNSSGTVCDVQSDLWKLALEEAAKVVEEARGINRNPDGSIESILVKP